MYSIKDESDHHYEIATKDGGSFHIAKKGLTPAMHEKIKKMCEGGMAHYAEGTDDAEPEDANVEAPPTSLQEEAPTPAAPLTGEMPQNVQPTDTNTAQQLSNALTEEKQGAFQQGQAQQQLGQAESKILGGEVTNAQTELQRHAGEEAVRLGQQKELANQIANSQVDPKAYFDNLSTAGQVSTIAGLILGGLGAGPSGVNQAVNVLNQKIAQDVDAQKANIGNKFNLYQKNLEASQDERQATLLTQSQQLSIAQAKLAQAAVKNQTPQAQANYTLASAAIDKQQAALSQQLFLFRLQNKIATGGKFDAQLAPFAKDPKSVVSFGDGTAIQASSPQAAAKVQEVLGQTEPALNTLKQLKQLAVNPIRPASPQYQQAKSLTSTLIGQLRSATGITRLNEDTMKLLESSFNDPTKLEDVILHDERTKTLEQSLMQQRDAKIAPYLPSYKGRQSLGFKSAQ